MPEKKPQKRLVASLEAFACEYASNGGNGTRAWQATHPKASVATAATGAWEALRKPEVRARVAELTADRFKRLQMSGDEALGRVGLDARADIAELYDDAGKLLPPRHWPKTIRNSVKAVRYKDGEIVGVVLNDSLRARQLVLEQAGMMKNPIAEGINDLARLLANAERERKGLPPE